ncbi:TetR/AcrR family transcriptional regulator [Trinickia acidisoli]|uniref:TetR/AcrR family transcriptional regulator n=1 Tax=Trinickia acidisoli TaxID=2767482 RepID=UPI001A8E6D66|nr:TetR/AcrR family transcriptional regulator [Trinickia acidisoli]
MPERGRPRSFDRETALQQAMEVFWARGYEGTSMADLTAAMGIKAPSLYAAFGDKAALFREAVAHYRATEGSSTSKALREAVSAREAVEGMLMAATADLTMNGRPRGCLVVLGATNCAPPNGAANEFLRGLRLATSQDIRKRLVQGLANGELPKSTDVDDLTAYFVTVLHGMSLQARDGVTQKTLEAVVRTAMAIWPPPQQATRYENDAIQPIASD